LAVPVCTFLSKNNPCSGKLTNLLSCDYRLLADEATIMFRRVILVVTLTTVGGCSGPSDNPDGDRTAPIEQIGAPLFADLGKHGYSITTTNPLSQRYFNQGLKLAYGFNHHEAIRAFTEGARLDPGCAMCYWGQALALGPNINKAMDDADVSAAYAAAQVALQESAGSAPVERALILALTTRYDPQSNADRIKLDAAYANSMREVAEQFPDDLEVRTLFAESLMDLMPWDYYEADGTPKPETAEVINALEFVLANNPDHPGAIHLYIHAVEATNSPERAEPYADRLRNLVPGAGHLVHMPSHIYLRVGRYADASAANQRAAAADESYINQCKAQGFYPATYYPHNIHFLWFTSAMEGRRDISIEAARKIYGVLPLDQVEQFKEVEYFVPIPLLAYARFAEWDAILDETAPPESWPYASAMWHYTQGLAHVAKGDLDKAESDLSAVDEILAGDLIDTREILFVLGRSNSAVARDELAARIELARGNAESGIDLLRAAIEKEDALPYVEPPYWYYPIRQRLGAALLQTNAPAEAEEVFRRDLEIYKHNGWSLYGLHQSLLAQGREDEARQVEAQFNAIWQAADIELTNAVLD
jgi:tetratricopeptide (TPR) repeat protein